MNKQQIMSWLPLVGAKPANDQNRGGWVLSRCPLGPWRHDGGKSNPSAFAVRIEGGDSFVNCFSCGYHGSQSQLVLDVGYHQKKDPAHASLDLGKALQLIADAEDGQEFDFSAPDIEEVLFGDKPKQPVFPEAWLSTFPEAWEVADSRQYLQARSVPEEICNALDLRYDPNQRRVCFPVRDFSSRLRGLHGRAIDKDVDPRYRMYLHNKTNNPIIWLGEHWVDFEKPIVVVEGPFDLVSVMRVYRNVVSPLFANPNFEKLQRMGDALEWITLLDNGKAGDMGRKRISEALKKHVITHLNPPSGKDPGSMLVGELCHILQVHVALDEILLA